MSVRLKFIANIAAVVEYEKLAGSLKFDADQAIIANAKKITAEAALTWVTGQTVYTLKAENEKGKKRKLLNEAVSLLEDAFADENQLEPVLKEQIKKGRLV